MTEPKFKVGDPVCFSACSCWFNPGNCRPVDGRGVVEAVCHDTQYKCTVGYSTEYGERKDIILEDELWLDVEAELVRLADSGEP